MSDLTNDYVGYQLRGRDSYNAEVFGTLENVYNDGKFIVVNGRVRSMGSWDVVTLEKKEALND